MRHSLPSPTRRLRGLITAVAALALAGALLVAAPAVDVATATPNAKPHPLAGQLINSEPMTLSSPLAATGASGHRITYVSVRPQGGLTLVTGAVLLPPGTPPPGGWPVASWGHGTTGAADSCAPSILPDLGGFDTYVADLISAGYAVAATDYEGVGGPGAHPYLIAESAGRGVIDAVRAARQVSSSLSTTWVAVGHSQGSQAVAAANEIADTYGANLNLTGAIALAAPINLADSVLSRLDNIAGDFGSQALYLLILSGLATQHPELKYQDYLGSQAQDFLPLVETACLFEIAGAFAAANLPASEFAPVNQQAAQRLVDWLSQEGIPRKASTAPLAILAGDADEIVSPEEAEATKTNACALGTTTYLKIYPGVDHGGTIAVATEDSIDWMNDRVAGLPAPSSC